jgi:hypothetical protein
MATANEWWRRKQVEIDRADPTEHVRADLEAIKDQIDADIYRRLLGWIERGEQEYLLLAGEKTESLADFHRMTWGRVHLPEQGSGEGFDEIG